MEISAGHLQEGGEKSVVEMAEMVSSSSAAPTQSARPSQCSKKKS